jgi:hypothetical protein
MKVKVFQCMIDMSVNVYYDRYNLKAGQLIRAEHPELIKYCESHANIREVTDYHMIKVAPPIQAIKQPEDPYRMRKEDMLAELRSYGIAADPCSFSDKLSMQLKIARKMARRNFITILNEKGFPIYIDSAKIPVPSLNEQDDSLPEPETPDGDFFIKSKEVEDVKKTKKPLTPQEIIDKEEKDRKVAMSVSGVVDEEEEKNKGLTQFDQWVEKEYEIVNIDKEKEIKQFLFKDQGLSAEEIERLERLKQKGIKNEDILSQNFIHLVDTRSKRFMLHEVPEEEKDEMRSIKWAAVNFDVIENILRNHNIYVEYDEFSTLKRWDSIRRVQAIYESLVEKDRFAVELNMLQKRHDEICKHEPQYRKFTDISLKKRATELSRYGLAVWYKKDTDIRKHCSKLYALAKLGLDVPQTEEEINELLLKVRRSAFVNK